MNLLMLITNGFEEVEAVGTIGILRRAKLNLDVASLHDHSATGRFGATLTNLLNIDDIDASKYDVLVLAGGPQYVEMSASEKVKQIIMHFHEKDKYIAAICAAPTILGEMGLLKNKKYTCFTSMNKDFGGTYVDEYTIRDGKLVTGRSAAATIDFALNIVEALKGKEFTDILKKSIYY